MICISIKSAGLAQSGPVESSACLTRDGSALVPRLPSRSRQQFEARGTEGDQDQRWEDIQLLLHHQLQWQGGGEQEENHRDL